VNCYLSGHSFEFRVEFPRVCTRPFQIMSAPLVQDVLCVWILCKYSAVRYKINISMDNYTIDVLFTLFTTLVTGGSYIVVSILFDVLEKFIP
jgi:hypothetical protein